MSQEDSNKSVDAKADELVSKLLSVDTTAFVEKDESKQSVEKMGEEVVRRAVKQSAMLRQPVKELSARAEDGGEVANALVNLKLEVEKLDPSKLDLEAGWMSRTLGMIPGVGTPLKRYFSKYESAQTIIAAIIRSLENGREQLGRDNVTLTEDQKQMAAALKELEQTIALAKLVDQKLQYKMDRELEAGSEKYKFVGEELLFPLRQRILDLSQQMLVNQQGILAMELIVRNNKELIRGVNRALNVTVSALEVGATVAMGLANQKVVLDKINSVNKTTSDLLASTASRLKTQGVEIQKQASSSQLDMNSLKSAFADINTAMEDIAQFRMKALPEMASKVLELDKMAGDAQKVIEKMEKSKTKEPKLIS